MIVNGKVLHTVKYDPGIHDKANTVYEVLRMIAGKAVFLHDHLERMMASLRQSSINHKLDPAGMEKMIDQLIKANPVHDGNIYIGISEKHDRLTTSACFIKHQYPSPDDYIHGVELESLRAVRKNPNAKIWNDELRNQANQIISAGNIYEALLVDNNGNITEGSRSNIFFIREGRLLTPAANMVLKGITRQKVIEICSLQDIPFSEEPIAYNNLESFDTAFITGTSPKLLPVRKIDSFIFSVDHHILRTLMRAYDDMLPHK